VRLFKGKHWHVLTPDTMRPCLEQPTFAEVGLADLDYYLAEVVDGSFFIAEADLATAHARCLAALPTLTDYTDEYISDALRTTTLVELLDLHHITGVTDADDNVVNLVHSDGDMWVFDHLDVIADLIRTGSYFLLQDDTGLFWRVEYSETGARYYRDEAPTD
jgi:hypothetical protein